MILSNVQSRNLFLIVLYIDYFKESFFNKLK